MQTIDFLPVQYRQKHMRRQSQPWRIIVVAAFVALLAAAAVTQHDRKRRTEEELAVLMPQYNLALSQTDQLAKIHSGLQTAEKRAELLTYLRHPWPRSQLLAALLSPLPDEITLRQVQIVRQTAEDRPSTGRPSRPKLKSKENEFAGLLPADRDLQRLRRQFDETRTVISVSGTASDSAAVHQYLAELGTDDLFCKAELDWMGTPEDGSPGSDFRATLVVRPGYGQPGGPAPARETALARCDRAQVPQRTRSR